MPAAPPASCPLLDAARMANTPAIRSKSRIRRLPHLTDHQFLRDCFSDEGCSRPPLRLVSFLAGKVSNYTAKCLERNDGDMDCIARDAIAGEFRHAGAGAIRRTNS